MKRFYLRRKTLLIFAIAFLAVLGAGYFITPKLLASSIDKQEQAGKQDASSVLKERLIHYFPGSEEARWEAYSLADSLLQEEERVLIGPDFTSGGAGRNLPFTAEELISYLLRVAEAQQEGMWKYNSYEKAAQLYKMQGNYDKAEENFLEAAQGFEKEKQDFKSAEVNGSLAEIYLETGQAEKALALVEQSMQKYPKQRQGDFLSQKGDAYLLLGDYVKAEQTYREALEQAKKEWESFREGMNGKASNINATLETQPVYRHSLSGLERLAGLKSAGRVEKGKVAGQIFSGIVPMPNVVVYLIKEQGYEGRMNHLEEIAAQSSVQTDAGGGFEFEGVAPGKYFIVLGILPEDLEGLGRFKGLEAFTVEAGRTVEQKYVFQPRVKISEPSGQQTYKAGEELRIKWEKVPQAASYNLHITLKLENGYVSRVYRQHLKENSYLFNPRGLALREMNFVASGDRDGLAPSAILGSFYPGAEIFFVIEALDEQGRSISDSEGYVLQLNGNYPSVQVQEHGVLSSGDKFVIERKYPEAIEAYLEKLKGDPDDPQALLSLARIYSCYDLIKGKPDSGTGGSLADPVQALEYYRQLLQVTTESFIIEEAASTAVQADQDKLALELYEKIEDTFEKDSFWYHLMGELYFKTGRTAKALPYYLKYLNSVKEFRDLGPVIVLLYQDDVNGAITLLQTKGYSQRVRYSPEGETIKPADIQTLLSNLQRYKSEAKSILSKGDFRKYLLEIINIDGRNRLEKVKAFQEKITSFGENDVLVKALNELAADRL